MKKIEEKNEPKVETKPEGAFLDSSGRAHFALRAKLSPKKTENDPIYTERLYTKSTKEI